MNKSHLPICFTICLWTSLQAITMGNWGKATPIEPSYSLSTNRLRALRPQIWTLTTSLGQSSGKWSFSGHTISQQITVKNELCSPSIALTVKGPTTLSQYSPLPLSKIENIYKENQKFGPSIIGVEDNFEVILTYKSVAIRDKEFGKLKKLLGLCQEYSKNEETAYLHQGRFTALEEDQTGPFLQSESFFELGGDGLLDIRDEMSSRGGYKLHSASTQNDPISVALLRGKESYALRWKQLEKLDTDKNRKKIRVQVLHWGGDEAGITIGEKLIALKQKGHDPLVYIDTLSPFADIRSPALRENTAALYHRMMSAGIPVYGYVCNSNIGTLFQSQREDFAQAYEQIRKNSSFSVQNLYDTYMFFRKNVHDKIWSIEGENPIIGGMNIVNPYFDLEKEGPEYWRDQDFVINNKNIAQEIENIIDRNIKDYIKYYKDAKKMSCYNPYDPIKQKNDYYEFLNNSKVIATISDSILYIISFGNIGSSQFEYEGFSDYNPINKGIDERTFKSSNKTLYEVNRLKQGIIDEIVKDSAGRKTIKRHNINNLVYLPVNTFRMLPNRTKYNEHFISDALTSMIDRAKSEVFIVHAYIIPTEEFIETIRRAIARGVKFYFMTNTNETNDLPIMIPMQRSLFKRYMDMTLNPSQVTIYEWNGKDKFGEKRRGMLHAKVVVVDRQFVMGGSYNLDSVSENTNSETNFVLDSRDIAEKFIKEFKEDYIPFAKSISYQKAMIYKNPTSLKDQASLSLSTLLRSQW